MYFTLDNIISHVSSLALLALFVPSYHVGQWLGWSWLVIYKLFLNGLRVCFSLFSLDTPVTSSLRAVRMRKSSPYGNACYAGYVNSCIQISFLLPISMNFPSYGMETIKFKFLFFNLIAPIYSLARSHSCCRLLSFFPDKDKVLIPMVISTSFRW